MDRIFNESDLRSSTGGIGLLTHDVVTRIDLTKEAFLMALTPFINNILIFYNIGNLPADLPRKKRTDSLCGIFWYLSSYKALCRSKKKALAHRFKVRRLYSCRFCIRSLCNDLFPRGVHRTADILLYFRSSVCCCFFAVRQMPDASHESIRS